MGMNKPIAVSLHREDKLTDTIKYRNTWSAASTLATTTVSIGNFSNKNIFCDNSIEIGMTSLIPNHSATYSVASQANYIKLVFESYTVIGYIIDWNYTNDTNISIRYVVDSFSSAIASNLITDIYGICNRTNLSYTKNFVNLQSEPFSPSDISLADSIFTKNLNEAVHNIEGINPTEKGANNGNIKFILTVSPAVLEYINGGPGPSIPPFYSPGNLIPELKDVTSLNFPGHDTTANCGGVFRGFPLKFDTADKVQDFIRSMLNGCGFRCTMPAAGYDKQTSVVRRTMAIKPDNGGQLEYYHKNWNNDAYECIRFLSGNDIYALYAIPENFAIDEKNYIHHGEVIQGLRTVDNLHEFQAEDEDKGRLLAYPYCYTRLVTANNDTVDITPQTMQEHDGTFECLPQIQMVFRYMGGDTPRLMGAIVPNRSDVSMDMFAKKTVLDWFTIRSYPTITLSFSDTFNLQSQLDMANTKKFLANSASMVARATIDSPFGQTYRDTVKGGISHDFRPQTEGLGLLDTAYAYWGNQAGAIAKSLGGSPNITTDTLTTELQGLARGLQAGNLISPGSNMVMGNDFQSQLGIPAFAAYRCGATDAELFAFCRYLDMFGHACNCVINPITNVGNLFNGNATVTPFEGRTFYKFSDITVYGIMPNEWRLKIKELFENGVYLIDN